MLLQNTTAYLNHSFHAGTDLRIAQGHIREVGTQLSALPGESCVDCGGDFIIPGFVDVHIHAFRGNDAMQGEAAVRTMARELRREGVAAFCPTTMSASEEATRLAMAGIRQARLHAEAEEALIPGAHMEAPFLSVKKAGAQRKEFFLDPSWEAFERMTDGHPGEARLMTMAPEREGSEAFIRRISSDKTAQVTGPPGNAGHPH